MLVEVFLISLEVDSEEGRRGNQPFQSYNQRKDEPSEKTASAKDSQPREKKEIKKSQGFGAYSTKMAGKKKSPSLVFLRNETDIFSENGYDVSVQSTDYTHYYPTSSIGDSSIPISFFIQGDDLHYIDLSQTAIFIRGRVLDNANNSVPVYNKETRVAPVNNFLHSLFEQCVVHLNETQITPSTNLYMYRALIETILAFSGDSTDTIGATSFYFKEHTKIYDPANEEPWKARQALIQGGNEFDLIGRPHLDICAQTRYLIPGVDIRFTFHRTRPEFYMMQQKTDLKYRFDITQARLIVKRHTLLPSILANRIRSGSIR